jgi:hypothetical protein
MTRFTPMEGLVRPFESPRITPLAGPNLVAPVPPGIVEAKLGGSGGRTTSFSLDEFGINSVKKDDFKESDRKSTLVRVENEDDPGQFVEFCRADKITLTRKENKTPPPKGSSYDVTGGQNPSASGKQNVEYQYPEEKTCKPKTPPKGGDCD